jgi:CO/xanthine dehydrogenase FAD-binding subunit
VSGHFRKVGRVAGDIAKLSVAVTAEKSLAGVVNWHVAMGSVAPIPMVLREVEALLNRNRPLDDDFTSAIRATVAWSIAPIDDVRSTAWYRKRVSGVTVSDLCEQVWKELEGGKA